MSAQKKEEIIKIALVGCNLVGKASLGLRYVEDKFEECTAVHIGMDFKIKKTRIENTDVKLFIWTMPGHRCYWKKTELLPFERFNFDGVVMVYDVSDKSTFGQLSIWKDLLIAQKKETPITIVGNKIDSEKQLVMEDAFVPELNADYMETSAKTGENVKELFELMVKRILVAKNIITLPTQN